MIKRHVIYCDHCLDSVVEAGSNARERKPATVSHEVRAGFPRTGAPVSFVQSFWLILVESLEFLPLILKA